MFNIRVAEVNERDSVAQLGYEHALQLALELRAMDLYWDEVYWDKNGWPRP